MTSPRTRRAVLRASVLTLSLLAGCSLPGGDDEPTTPQSYPHLEATTVYLDPRVRLDLPSAVTVAEAPADSEVALLPTDPDIDPNRAVEWLVGDTAVGIVGRPADEFLLRVQQSERADEELAQRGYAVAESPPDLQFGHLVDNGDGGEILATSSFTWEDLDDEEVPDDERVLDALESFLEEEASETPRR